MSAIKPNGDSRSRANFYKDMIDSGIMNINQVRALEGMNSIGDVGDKYYISLDYMKGGENNAGD